jgi:membrane-associated phospholipid phosphatase
LGALGVLYLYGHATDNDKAQKAVLLSIESFAITGVFVQTLKFSTHRHRPYTGDPYNTWGGPSFDNNRGHTAFPSGDASSAFAIATVIASEYDNYVIVPPLAYGAATAIALGRVHDNAHWSSDVFVASAIGYFIGKAIVRLHASETKSNLTLIPVIDGKNTDLLLTYRF